MGQGLVVVKWGARMVYEQDIEDLKQNMPGSSNCSITPYEDNTLIEMGQDLVEEVPLMK